MSYAIKEWLNLIFRWTHVFAAILWVGQTYFFTWLDGRLSDPDENGQVWMVHSGGFYVVEKQKRPELSRALHWFRYEAAATWISGVALFVLLYYLGGLLIDSESPMRLFPSILASLALIAIAWTVYDLLWSSPLEKNELAGIVLSYALLVGLCWLCTRLFSSRAAYLQVGAVLGTIMVANVWMRILPGQRKMIAAVKAGDEPDQRLAARSKARSKHNTFIVIPVVLIMISNHFPTATYGNEYNWIILSVLILVGWGAAKVIRTR
ncbi:MAG: urate hydroxylase PuuD [Acidobacteriota bacterium]